MCVISHYSEVNGAQTHDYKLHTYALSCVDALSMKKVLGKIAQVGTLFRLLYRGAFLLKTERKERKGNYSDLEVPENPLLC